MKLEKYCMSQKQGDEIFYKIFSRLEKGETICLDFAETDVVTAVFLNRAIGRLHKFFECPENYLLFTNLSDFQNTLIKRVMKNSQWYFSSPKVVDEVILNHVYS